MVHWLTILALTTAPVGGPSTGGTVVLPPVAPAVIGQAIDPHAPAFLPKFARVDNPPGGRFAERDWAYRYGSAAPFWSGYGGWGGGCYGYAGGFHNFEGHFIGTAGDAFR